MKRKFTFLAAAIFLICSAAVSRAQDFSADVVYFVAGKAPSATGAPHQPSKLFVSTNKMRLETRGVTGTILLVNSEDHSVKALFPDHKSYQPLSSAPAEYFHVEDPENACSDWEKVSEGKIACEKVGHEEVNGHQTVKYQNKAATLANPLTTIWIDPTLKFVAKWEGKETGAELRNITMEQKLSSALFEVPPAYELMKPKRKGAKAPGK